MITLAVLVFLALIAAGAAAWFWRRNEIESAWSRLWDFIVRWRTTIAGAAAVLLVTGPDLLLSIFRDPEFVALVPDEWDRWVNTAAIVLIVLTRLRPATRTADPEVQAKIAADTEAKITGLPVDMLIKPAGEKSQIVAVMEPKGVVPK